MFEKAIVGMALLRFLSGTMEIVVAFLILKINQVDKALVLNSSLSIIGPIIFLSTTAIGLYSIANEVSFTKLIWILLGIIFIIYGVSK
jgi:putative exporter of polyketide antibiotics